MTGTTPKTRTALVAGATGAVGRALLDLLLKDPVYERVVVVARRPTERRHDKLDWRVVDFDALERSLVGLKADDVFSALGTTMKQAGSKQAFRKVDFEYVVALARAGRAAGAHCFVLNSSVGADAKASSFYLQVKGEAEAAVGALDYASASWVRPSLLLAERSERRWGEEAAAAVLPALSGLLRGSLQRYRAVPTHTVAQVMLGLAHARRPGNRSVEHADFDAFAD